MSGASDLPVGKGYTESDWTKWFKGFVKNNPKIPRYTGTDGTIKGKTWDQVYPTLYAYDQKHHPGSTPDQIAQAELILIENQAIAAGIGSALDFTGTTVEISGKSVVGGIDQFNSGIANPLAILGDLTSANLWIRVGKVVIGGIILTVGLIELTGQSENVKGIAGKAVKAAPLLL